MNHFICSTHTHANTLHLQYRYNEFIVYKVCTSCYYVVYCKYCIIFWMCNKYIYCLKLVSSHDKWWRFILIVFSMLLFSVTFIVTAAIVFIYSGCLCFLWLGICMGLTKVTISSENFFKTLLYRDYFNYCAKGVFFWVEKFTAWMEISQDAIIGLYTSSMVHNQLKVWKNQSSTLQKISYLYM